MGRAAGMIAGKIAGQFRARLRASFGQVCCGNRAGLGNFGLKHGFCLAD